MDVELAEVDTDTPVATRRVPHARVRRLYVVASSVIALHVAAVTWLSAGGGLYIDDIRAQAYAAGRPFYPFVIESNRTHLAPGARTIDWFMARYAPLEHWPAVVITDSTGPAAANDSLAQARAQAVLRELVALAPGIASRVRVEAQGACCFIESNDGPAGRARNRRVEIRYWLDVDDPP